MKKLYLLMIFVIILFCSCESPEIKGKRRFNRCANECKSMGLELKSIINNGYSGCVCGKKELEDDLEL